MCGSCASECVNLARDKHVKFYGLFINEKSTLILYDWHLELQSKWDKAFWARGHYMETVDNITDEAAQKYIKEQAEESRKEDKGSTTL